MIRCFEFILSAAILAATASHGQTTIPPRHLEKIVYDDERKCLIVFGGAEFRDKKLSFPSNVSMWYNSKWTIIDAQGPGTRSGHSFIYHEDEKVSYVVSGMRNDNDGEHVILDVWKWEGDKWTEVATDAPMKTSDGAYDSHNKRLLVLGDVYNKTKPWDGGDPQKFELWEFRNTGWKKLSSEAPQADGPYEVAYDKHRRALVIPVWESGKSVVWEWVDERWNKIQVAGDYPEKRNRFALAYDEGTKATYMFGGRNDKIEFFADFWKWNGSQWEQIIPADLPPGRAGATMEADDSGLILYGGVIEKGPCNEIWIYQGGRWKKH